METVQFLAQFVLGLIGIFVSILIIEKIQSVLKQRKHQKQVIAQTRQRIKNKFGI